MNVVQTLLWLFSWLAFAYFVVYGVCQVAFTLIAWKTLAGYRHAQAFSPLDEVYASPFTPPVSIILPAYNEEAGVVASVHSLLDLRYPRYEVIVVNDGSLDGTGDWVQIWFATAPGTLSYYLMGNSFAGGTFDVQESPNGTTWTTLHSFTTNMPTASYTQFTDTYQEANGLLYMDRTPKIPIEDIKRATSG